MADMVKLTIDGKEVEVPKGTPVIRAAIDSGVKVPHYCYHPGLTIAGNCRMCLVEIEKMPKLVTSCTTPAADGMVVHTKSDKVKQAIAGVEEFLLANHPLDCPICDQAGECVLQDYSYKHGKGSGRFREERLRFKKSIPVGTHVVLDQERCIMCTRCVRFCNEITQTGELGVFQRGLHNEIGIFPGRTLENAYSGNTVDICPVGALTLREARFGKRVWYQRDVPSVCGTCAQGCNVNLGTATNKIWRLKPRENAHVNGWWMCDEGRVSIKEMDELERLTAAGMKEGGGFAPVLVTDAAARIASALKQDGGRSAVVASGSLTVEDFWLLKKLATEGAPGLRVVVPERRRGEDDGFLIRADRTANRKGAALLRLDVDEGGASSRALMDDVASRKITTLLAIGEDVATLPGGGAALETLGRSGTLISVSAFSGLTEAEANLRVPCAAYGEFEGTWVNHAGRAQRVRRGVTPRTAVPVWQILAMALGHLAEVRSYANAAEILREVAGAVAAFEGVTWTALGAGGRSLEAKDGPDPDRAPKGLPEPAWVAHG